MLLRDAVYMRTKLSRGKRKKKRLSQPTEIWKKVLKFCQQLFSFFIKV